MQFGKGVTTEDHVDKRSRMPSIYIKVSRKTNPSSEKQPNEHPKHPMY